LTTSSPRAHESPNDYTLARLLTGLSSSSPLPTTPSPTPSQGGTVSKWIIVKRARQNAMNTPRAFEDQEASKMDVAEKQEVIGGEDKKAVIMKSKMKPKVKDNNKMEKNDAIGMKKKQDTEMKVKVDKKDQEKGKGNKEGELPTLRPLLKPKHPKQPVSDTIPEAPSLPLSKPIPQVPSLLKSKPIPQVPSLPQSKPKEMKSPLNMTTKGKRKSTPKPKSNDLNVIAAQMTQLPQSLTKLTSITCTTIGRYDWTTDQKEEIGDAKVVVHLSSPSKTLCWAVQWNSLGLKSVHRDSAPGLLLASRSNKYRLPLFGRIVKYDHELSIGVGASGYGDGGFIVNWIVGFEDRILHTTTLAVGTLTQETTEIPMAVTIGLVTRIPATFEELLQFHYYERATAAAECHGGGRSTTLDMRKYKSNGYEAPSPRNGPLGFRSYREPLPPTGFYLIPKSKLLANVPYARGVPKSKRLLSPYDRWPGDQLGDPTSSTMEHITLSHLNPDISLVTKSSSSSSGTSPSPYSKSSSSSSTSTHQHRNKNGASSPSSTSSSGSTESSSPPFPSSTWATFSSKRPISLSVSDSHPNSLLLRFSLSSSSPSNHSSMFSTLSSKEPVSSFPHSTVSPFTTSTHTSLTASLLSSSSSSPSSDSPSSYSSSSSSYSSSSCSSSTSSSSSSCSPSSYSSSLSPSSLLLSTSSTCFMSSASSLPSSSDPIGSVKLPSSTNSTTHPLLPKPKVKRRILDDDDCDDNDRVSKRPRDIIEIE